MTTILPPQEDAATILVKVQDELRHLRDQIANNSNCDIATIQNAILHTEKAVQGRAEEFLTAQQNRVLTLPNIGHPSVASLDSIRPRLSKIKNFGSLHYSDSKGPGELAKEHYHQRMIHAPLHQPDNPISRDIIQEKYGVFKPREKQVLPAILPPKPLLGPTVKGSAALPRQNRMDPRLTPPAITEQDAKRGILSLCERGLIPPAAELTLEPSPIKQQQLFLHNLTSYAVVEKIADVQELELTMAGVRLDSSINDGPNSTVYPKMNTVRLTTNSAKSQTSTIKMINTPFTQSSVLHPIGPPQSPTAYIKQSLKFTIQQGRTVTDSPDFDNFRRECGKKWHYVVPCIQELELLLTRYAIPLAIVEGEKLISLADDYQMDLRPKVRDLIKCCSNDIYIFELIRKPGQIYKGVNGPELAAAKIQATYKMYLERERYLSYRKRKQAAGVIAMNYVMRLKLINIRNKIKDAKVVYAKNFKQRTKTFKKNWDALKQKKRVHIHIPSLSYSEHIRNSLIDLSILQNSQMGRICEVNDPNVDVIYISPIDLDADIKLYYAKLLTMGVSADGETIKEADKKVTFIVPEYVTGFSGVNLSLSSLLLYSSKTMKRLQGLVAGRECVIIPGVMGEADLELSDKLDVPILGTAPKVIEALTSKSGAKRLFMEADVNIPPSQFDIYSEDQIFEYLSVLIVNNLSVRRWVFKIDSEFDARGTAYCDIVSHLSCYKWALRQAKHYGEKWSKRWAQEPTISKIFTELPQILHNHLNVINTTLYPSIETFISAFTKSGGIVEAWPNAGDITCITVDMLIDPTGNVEIKNTGDQIRATEFQTWALSSPQTSINPTRLHLDCFSIAKCAFKKGVIGYISTSFVTFIDEKSLKQKLWAIDLKLQYTDSMCMANILQFTTGGKFDQDSGVYRIPEFKVLPEPLSRHKSPKARAPPNRRYAVLAPRLLHSNLSLVHYSVFFQMCRAHLIGYDLREREGTVFTLLDSYKRDLIGMITVEPELSSALKSFARNLSTIHQEISSINMPGNNNFISLISETEEILQSLGVNLEDDEKSNDNSE